MLNNKKNITGDPCMDRETLNIHQDYNHQTKKGTLIFFIVPQKTSIAVSLRLGIV